MAYRQALTAYMGLHGDNHVATADARLKLGRILNLEQEFKPAEEELRKAVAAFEEHYGEEDLRTAESYALLGTILNRQGGFEEALSFHEKALAARKEQLGDSHSDVKFSAAAVAVNRDGKHEDEIAL